MQLRISYVKSISTNKTILIFGDYDVDGTTSAAFLTIFFRSINVESHYYIPSRENEGYGVSNKGIDYNSPDGQDCHMILLTLSPADDPTEHRKFISRFRSMVQNPNIRSSLYESVSRDEIINIISQWEEDNNRRDDLV